MKIFKEGLLSNEQSKTRISTLESRFTNIMVEDILNLLNCGQEDKTFVVNTVETKYLAKFYDFFEYDGFQNNSALNWKSKRQLMDNLQETFAERMKKLSEKMLTFAKAPLSKQHENDKKYIVFPIFDQDHFWYDAKRNIDTFSVFFS